MIAPLRSIPQDKASQILQEYLHEGMSVHMLHMKHHPVPRTQIVQLLHDMGVMRPKAQKSDPSHEEISERAREIRATWSEEETRRRWVGSASASFQSSLVGRG